MTKNRIKIDFKKLTKKTGNIFTNKTDKTVVICEKFNLENGIWKNQYFLEQGKSIKVLRWVGPNSLPLIQYI